MSRRQRKSHRRHRQPFLEKGLSALMLGAGFFVASAFLSNHPVLSSAGKAVQTPAWIAMGIGAVLLAIHWLQRRSPGVEKTEALTNVTAHVIRPAEWGNNAEPSRPRIEPVASLPTTWSGAVFNMIEWRRFEAVCEALFAQAGFSTRAQSHGPDGGVDIWLHSKNAQGPVSLVQCKHWRSKPIGVRDVREFFGVMASQNMKRGTYATTSTFTADATAFARSNGIHLLDGAGLLNLIAQRTPEQQQALLAVAFEGDYARPTCASCGTKMVERTPSKGGAAFWGCKNYPRCKSRLPMARAVV